MSLNTRTLFSVFVAVLVSATFGHLVSAQKAASKVNYCLSSALQITSVQDLKNVVFEECIHQQIKNEEDENEINYYMHDFVNKHISLQQRWKRYKRQVYQPPQVDEKLVSAFLNSPEAVKMVLSYLDKQKKLTTTTRTTTTKRPKPRPRPPKRRPPPPLSFFFGGDKPLSQLLNEHRKTVKKIQDTKWKKTPAKTANSSPRPQPRTTPKSANNPQLLTGNFTPVQKADNMQFFGPKDFVPESPYNLPRRPMRLKYSSTKDFPTRTYGRLVPMPR